MSENEGTTQADTVLEAAIRQATGPAPCVRVLRKDIAQLMAARDSEGEPLFRIRYDRAAGLQPEFMGKPIVWQHLS